MDAATASLDHGWLSDQPAVHPSVRRHIAHQYRLLARNKVFTDPDKLLAEAERHLHTAIRLGEQVYGANHPQTLGCVVELGEGALGLAAATREGVLANDYASWPGRIRRALNTERVEKVHATCILPTLPVLICLSWL